MGQGIAAAFHRPRWGAPLNSSPRSAPLVARLVRGYVETIHVFKTRRAEVIPLLQRFLMFKDLRAVEEAYDFYAPLFQPLPRPSASGIQKLLQELALKQPVAANLSVDAAVDLSFLDELERVGFVRNLYGRQLCGDEAWPLGNVQEPTCGTTLGMTSRCSGREPPSRCAHLGR